MNDQNARGRADPRDRSDIAARVVRQSLVQPGARRERDVIDEQRVTIAGRFRYDIGAERTARARAIVDDESLAKLFAELLAEITRDEIARAAGRERHDEP